MEYSTITMSARLPAMMVASALFFIATRADAVPARAYQLGDGGSVAPHLRLEVGVDDNPLRANGGSRQSSFLILEPSVDYIVQRRNNSLTIAYEGNFVRFFESYCRDQIGVNGVEQVGDCQNGSPEFDNASYQDQEISALGRLEISRRFRANLELSQSLETQPLGTGLSSNPQTLLSLVEPDSFDVASARLEFAYGAEQARGELRFGVSFRDKEFNNDSANPGRNAALENLNEHSTSPDARILYRIGNTTQVFLGIGSSEVRGGNSPRDISRQFFGFEFAATSITSGSVRITNETEDFLNNNRRDLRFTGWEVELEWKPRRFSTVTVSGGRETQRGLFGDNIALRTDIDIDWRHFWKERFSTRLGLNFARNEDIDEFSSQTLNSTADDRLTGYSFEANYNLRRWLDVGGFIRFDSRDGRGVDRDFDRTLIGVTANGTI